MVFLASETTEVFALWPEQNAKAPELSGASHLQQARCYLAGGLFRVQPELKQSRDQRHDPIGHDWYQYEHSQENK